MKNAICYTTGMGFRILSPCKAKQSKETSDTSSGKKPHAVGVTTLGPNDLAFCSSYL